MKRYLAVLFVIALAVIMAGCNYTGCYTYNVNTGAQSGSGTPGPVTITDNSAHGAVTSTQTISPDTSLSNGLAPGIGYSTGTQQAPSSNVSGSMPVYSPGLTAYKECLDANPGHSEKCDSLINGGAK